MQFSQWQVHLLPLTALLLRQPRQPILIQMNQRKESPNFKSSGQSNSQKADLFLIPMLFSTSLKLLN